MNNLKKAAHVIKDADAILVSASNGLSISEGVNIFANNGAFHHYFGNLQVTTGIQNILQGFSSQLSPETRQLFNQRLRKYLITDYHGSCQYGDLKAIIGEKDYFIITSNADTHFQQNGFAETKLWEIEGNFFNLRMQSPEWQQQASFRRFINAYQDYKLVQLELGIGAGNQLIKVPLMRMVSVHPQWSYITLNLEKELNVYPNGLLRQFYPKGQPIKQSFLYLHQAVQAINTKPRKLLHYHTAQQCFHQYLAS